MVKIKVSRVVREFADSQEFFNWIRSELLIGDVLVVEVIDDE